METELKPESPTVKIKAEKRIRWPIFAAVFVFLLLLGLTVWLWWFTKNISEREAKTRFDEGVTEIESSLRDQIHSCLDVLSNLEGLFEASESVGRAEWWTFIERQRHKTHYSSGIERLDFIERVRNSERDVFVQSVRSDRSVDPAGYPDFSIHPAGNREEYFVSIYLEPFRGNEKAFGLDHGTYRNRLQAMAQARDLNEPQATAPTTLVTDSRQQPAFFIFLPIYQNRAPISTIAQRQSALQGFVAGIFKYDDLFSIVFKQKKSFQGIAFKIFEGDELNQYLTTDHLIYQSIPDAEGGSEHPRFSTLVSLNVGGRVWTVHFYTTPYFYVGHYYDLLPLFVLFGGAAFSIVVFAFLYSLARSQSRAVQIAQRMIEQLRESEERFRSVTKSANDAIITADSRGNIVAWNEGAEKMFGYSEEMVLGKPLTAIMPERFRKLHMEGIKRMNTTGETHVIGKTVELVGLNKDGNEFPIEVSLSSWKTKKEIFFAGIIRDITERKRAQEILIKKTEELTQINTELERFNRVAVGREMRMIELKREINALCQQLGKEPAYDLSFADNAPKEKGRP